MRKAFVFLLVVLISLAVFVSCDQDTEDNTFTVTFEGNAEGVTGQMTPQSVARYYTEKLAANSFTREGWLFRSWNTKADGSGVSYSDMDSIRLAKDITLYAQWTYNKVKVSFKSNHDFMQIKEQEVTRKTETELEANTFTRLDYDFTGWNTLSGGTGITYEDGAKISIANDMTLYAQWVHQTAIVSFSANGGTGTMADQSVLTNTETPLSQNTFIWVGHIFMGWNTQADGSGTAYADKAEVSINTGMTLYAQWEPSAEVTFDANGGSGTMETQIVPKSIATTLKPNTFTNGEMLFAGWNTHADGSGAAYSDKAQINTNVDVTLYAQWSDAVIMDESTTTLGSFRYTINRDVTIEDRITVTGDAILILPDGYTLTTPNGISVNEGKSLRIESSGASGTGSLSANGSTGNAAIGGDSGHESGNITITGGSINATVLDDGGAGIGAGIGGGTGCKAGSININGGNITAVAQGAFGIGKGSGNAETSDITIDNSLSVVVNFFIPVVPASSYTDAGETYQYVFVHP